MSYKQKPNLKLYEYKNGAFSLVAIIDDFADCSFENNLYQAGQFTITINYNIANASVFRRGLFVSFGATNEFGEILKVTDSIGEEGAGSQIRTITGYDCRYILKRRVIENLNNGGFWQMTAKGELCLRNLIKDQCGSGAELKRQLPIINTIPADADAIGKDYSVNENFTNLYDVCCTIATQSEIGWKIDFDGTDLTLNVFGATDKSTTVKFDTSFESLANGEFGDSSESFANAIYIGGKGQNEERDIYEGEDGTPEGLGRFEAWDNQSGLTTQDEYEAEALAMLNQYGQTIALSGNGLARCPYIYKEDYTVGDLITVAFSGHSAKVQILSITEHWEWGAYDLQFQFGKPINDLSDQLNLILRQIQRAGNKQSACDSVKWYTIPTDSAMSKSDVFFDTLGFTGATSSNSFTLYLDNEGTGAKNYNVYVKNFTGDKLTLTTGVVGATDLDITTGTYVASICVDEEGNITLLSATPSQTVQSGDNNPVTSDAVYQAIQGGGGSGGGVPLGTWVAFDDGITPDENYLQAGTQFDENTYPELYLHLGSDTVPYQIDNNRLGDFESFTISTNAGSPTIAPYDGFISVNWGVGGYSGFIRSIFVNGERIIDMGNNPSDQTSYQTISTPVKKGDSIYLSQTPYSSKARWYKYPLYIKATPINAPIVIPSADVQEIKNYTKNYVDAKESYSTTEMETGGTWIDGKTIYRKVLSGTLTVSGNGYVQLLAWSNLSDIDTLIKLEGTLKQTAGGTISFFNMNDLNARLYIAQSGSPNGLVFNSSQARTNVPYSVILEYTKS